MKNRRMRTRMYGGVRGRKTKKVGRNSKIFVFLLLDWGGRGCHDADFLADFFASWYSRRFNFYYHNFDSSEILEIAVKSSNMSWP